MLITLTYVVKPTDRVYISLIQNVNVVNNAHCINFEFPVRKRGGLVHGHALGRLLSKTSVSRFSKLESESNRAENGFGYGLER